MANNLEYLLDFVKRYRFELNASSVLKEANIILTPYKGRLGDSYLDPFQSLSERELETAKVYLLSARDFFLKNHELLGKVIKTSMIPDDKFFEVELIREGEPGELNTYKVSEKPLLTSLDGLQEFNDLIDCGAIPVLGRYNVDTYNQARKNIPSKELACLLAMKSIELILPSMKETQPEIILEARDKLHDQLPLFWSSMLKLSIELKAKIEDNMTEKEIMFETQEIVDATILPAIIELKQKIEIERKNWFYKILHPVCNGVKLFMGNPQLSTVNLASIGLTMGLNIADNFIYQSESVNKIKKEAGLTFLLRLDELI